LVKKLSREFPSDRLIQLKVSFLFNPEYLYELEFGKNEIEGPVELGVTKNCT